MTVETDQIFEVYLRNQDGDTYHLPLREGLREFLDPQKGYRLSIDIEGVVIVLRNAWDREQMAEIDSLLGPDHRSVEVCATIKGLDNKLEEDDI